MSDFDWVIIQLLVLFWGVIAFVLFMVLAPVVLFSANIKAHKKTQEESNGASASQPKVPGLVASDKDGRVIAMVAPDAEPPVPAVAKPPGNDCNLFKDVLLPVAAKVAIGIAKSRFNHRHHH